MREEKRSEIIQDALNFLDDEMIEEVESLRDGLVAAEESMKEENIREFRQKVVRKNTPWRKWATLAAGMAIFVLLGGIWDGINPEVHDMNTNPENMDGFYVDEEAKDKLESNNADDIVDSDATIEEENEDFMESLEEATETEESTETGEFTEMEAATEIGE